MIDPFGEAISVADALDYAKAALFFDPARSAQPFKVDSSVTGHGPAERKVDVNRCLDAPLPVR